MTDTIRWGILGTGDIARQFASDLKLLAGAELIAIGSRNPETAEAFAAVHGIPRVYGSYEALASDPDIDVVYVGTLNPCHEPNTLMCLERGKAVLCEKPLAMNAHQAQRMIAAARANKCFLMEAMWTRFFPAVRRVQSLLAAGAIGEVRHVRADFCYRADWDPDHRLFNKELGGGALLDLGVYTIAFADMVFARDPSFISSVLHIGSTGVDEQAALSLDYGEEGTAALTCSLRVHSPQEALIAGTEGHITLGPPFSQPDTYSLHVNGQVKCEQFARQGYGYAFEAAEVMTCLREGAVECERAPLDRSLAVIRIMDQVRAQWEHGCAME